MSFERIIPGTIEWDAFYANHIFRYQFVLDQVKKHNRTKVLDAASGVGYGSNFMASNGIAQVVGIDVSTDAIKIAKQQFARPGVTFFNDDCYTLDAAKKQGPYDAVVSCETLEHLTEPDKFVSQVFSALQPGGLLVLSTPNSIVTPDRTKEWDFHEKEYTPQELTELLTKHGFKNITLYGQSYSEIGVLRQEVREQLNMINSDPFVRVGRWIQKSFRGRKVMATLPERVNDFVLTEAYEFEANPPFVLFAVAFKG